MYNNFRSMCLTRPLSKLDYNIYFSKCSRYVDPNKCILISKRLINGRSEFYGTFLSTTPQLNESHLHSYLKNRESNSKYYLYDGNIYSVYDKLSKFSSGFEISMDSICFELNFNDNSYNFVNNTNGYPQLSESQDGHIEHSLTNNNLIFYNIMNNSFLDYENSYFNRKLVPANSLPCVKSFKYLPKNRMFESAQILFDSNVEHLTTKLARNDCLSLVQILYCLNTSVSYKHLCSLLERGLSHLSNLSTIELVKLGICVRGYLDNSDSYLNHFLLRIGSCLEDKFVDLKEYSQHNLIDNLIPLSLMQISEIPVNWSVLSNYNVLNKITENVDELDPTYQGKLLIILSSLEPYPDVSSKYYKVYEELVNSLTNTMDSVDNKVVLNMMHMPILFHSFEMFRQSLFSQTITRWASFPANTLASIYIKRKDDIPKESAEYILTRLQKHLNVILPKYIPELFCSYLNEGVLTLTSLNRYKEYIILSADIMSAKDISNILMYLSIHGKSRIEFYPNLISRFNDLKKGKALNNQELLDVVLSMSLVGIHNSNVWNNVDLNNLVYQLPRNILVYLGYSFLITNMNDSNLWKIVLDRILNENKNLTPETYEVLKAAKILEYIPKDYSNNKFETLLKGSRATFLARQSKQRYTSSVPYKAMFKHLGIQYYEDYLIDELYEAKYYLPECKIIILPVQNYILHPTSGMIAGDLMLRNKVWKQLNYKHHFFTDKKWSSFYDDNNKDNTNWDINRLSEAFCRETKIYNYLYKLKEKEKYLKPKGKPMKKGQLNNIKPLELNKSRIKMLQSIIVHET